MKSLLKMFILIPLFLLCQNTESTANDKLLCDASLGDSLIVFNIQTCFAHNKGYLSLIISYKSDHNFGDDNLPKLINPHLDSLILIDGLHYVLPTSNTDSIYSMSIPPFNNFMTTSLNEGFYSHDWEYTLYWSEKIYFSTITIDKVSQLYDLSQEEVCIEKPSLLEPWPLKVQNDLSGFICFPFKESDDGIVSFLPNNSYGIKVKIREK